MDDDGVRTIPCADKGEQTLDMFGTGENMAFKRRGNITDADKKMAILPDRRWTLDHSCGVDQGDDMACACCLDGLDETGERGNVKCGHW